MHTFKDIDEEIRDMDRVVGAMFASHRRDLQRIRANVKSRMRDPKAIALVQQAFDRAVERQQ